jgi:hypothetical protein
VVQLGQSIPTKSLLPTLSRSRRINWKREPKALRRVGNPAKELPGLIQQGAGQRRARAFRSPLAHLTVRCAGFTRGMFVREQAANFDARLAQMLGVAAPIVPDYRRGDDFE